jgi:RNA processing factor Prp31
MREKSDASVNSAKTFQDEDDFNEDRGDYFQESIEKAANVLDEAADKLYALAESLEVTGEDLEAITAGNDGKTQEEIDEEDALADQIAGPLVDALDTATAAINSMTEKVLEMTDGFLSDIFPER